MSERKQHPYSACKEPSEHRDHMCLLMEKGMTEEIRRRSSHPVFVCGNCAAQADSAEDLCNPKPLPQQEGK